MIINSQHSSQHKKLCETEPHTHRRIYSEEKHMTWRSTTLIIIVMDDIIKGTKSQVKPTVGYKKLQPITILVCALADDLVICGNSKKEASTL